jgi:NAD+ synthase
MLTGVSLGLGVGKEADKTAAFIARIVRDASARGVVVGLSGGIDSAVVGALCVRALGKGRILALLLPSDHTPRQDREDARKLADMWGVRREEVEISPIVDTLIKSAKTGGTKIARANVEARVRMVLNYYRANSLGYIVAGTGDRSEELLGFFTKYGDGGVDFMPIAHLFKTQVRELGAYLGVPAPIVEKPSSPQLWPGHRASDELPAEYEKLDIVLHGIFDLKATPEEAASLADVPLGVVNRVLEMHAGTEHKRSTPPSLA